LSADIEIDVFEVQLGAALLLRMEDSTGRTVSVLADGGIKAKNYNQDHVANKLKGILPSTDIDLVIGTHYDEDHLAGLIDVADQFSIGEAILPPIRRPQHPKGGTSVSSLQELNALDSASDLPLLIDLSEEAFAEHIEELEQLAAQAEQRLKEPSSSEDPLPDFEEEVWLPEEGFDLGDPFLAVASPPHQYLALTQLARIQSSAHKGAIVAKWLRQLVQKLRSKSVPIRAIDIAAGIPEYYAWYTSQRKFLSCSASNYAASSEPKFVLLGPSRSLIAQHAKKLPIGVYFALIGLIPLKPVTASNQLSYVMLFESSGQKILITGDAGCVDFWDKKTKSFYPALLSAMADLHVVQVAHHAGNNHRFYHVLQQIGYGSVSASQSFLLLSHSVNDTYRPSLAFASFISALPSAVPTFELLTTSDPDPSKVSAFRALYHSATRSPSATVGDIRLAYQNGAWVVNQHLVQV
jgi:hypothetical protein